MKVVLVNGSPHEKGCTFTALSEAAAVLNQEGLETDIFWVGNKPLAGCIGCGSCRKSGRCFIDDKVNEFVDFARDADGLIVGSPVHYAAASGHITSFMDRAFYSGSGHFKGKPGAPVVCCRRGGASAAFDQLIKYFTINCMPVISSTYWNSVHGTTPEEVRQDEEGMETMRILGKNMAWIIKSIEAGKAAGIEKPDQQKTKKTSFIR